MGKQSRRKRERSDDERDAAGRYLRRLGLPNRPDGTAYRRLAAADPAWFRQVSEADDRSLALAGDPDADPLEVTAVARAKYGLLYRDLDTALAEYASRHVAVVGPWLRWWYDHHPPAGRLLDVGCGVGILTCAYALALPDAEVVGVDVVPAAVECAAELAGRLGVGNVSFVAADPAAGAPDPEPAGTFDQIVAVTALGEAGLYPQQRPGQDPFSTLAEVDGPGQGFTAPAAGALAGRLAPGGWLLAFDRTPHADQAVWLGAALLHAGVDLDLACAGAEVLAETGDKTTFTRLAGIRTEAQPECTAGQVAAWVKAVERPAYGKPWHDELRFEQLKADGAELVWGAEINYAPYSPAVERREIWDHPSGAYGWVTTSMHLRELTRGRSVEALAAEYAAYAQKWAGSGLVVRRYGRR